MRSAEDGEDTCASQNGQSDSDVGSSASVKDNSIFSLSFRAVDLCVYMGEGGGVDCRKEEGEEQDVDEECDSD